MDPSTYAERDCSKYCYYSDLYYCYLRHSKQDIDTTYHNRYAAQLSVI
jgi:hypothetical protein